MGKKNSYPVYLKKNYEDSLVHSVKHLRWIGYFNYSSENKYSFLDVSKEFANLPHQILSQEGFCVRYLIRKNKFPGAHISITMQHEKSKIKWKTLRKVYRKWKNVPISFKITGIRIFWHEDQTGAKMWVLCFQVFSWQIFQLRKELNVKRNVQYNPHMTILENEPLESMFSRISM